MAADEAILFADSRKHKELAICMCKGRCHGRVNKSVLLPVFML